MRALFFFLLTMQPLSSKYKRHCFLQVVCDKGMNLFSLNDTAFLNRLAAEAILWEKKNFRELLQRFLEICSKSILRVTTGVLLLSQTTCPWRRLLSKPPPHLSAPTQNSTKAQPSCLQDDCIARLISSVSWQINRCVCLDRAQGPSSQIMKVFYISRRVQRGRGEGLPHQGILMSFTSARSPGAEAGAVPLSACRHRWCGCVGGPGDSSMDTVSIWHCPGALSEDL